MSKLRLGVVGVGHLGRAHARILAGLPEVDLAGVVDTHSPQARAVADQCGTAAHTDYRDLFGRVDAVTVVTPTTSHHEVARAFLGRGVPVMVEKPITVTLAEADDLIALADANGLTLQVGHIERFNPAFEGLTGRPIRPKFIECERHGPYTGRSTDIGAVLDLMIHDLDLLLTLVGAPVERVEAVGAPVFGGHEDMVNARLVFATGAVAHVTASRATARPKRRLRVWAPEGYAGVDFLHRRLTLVQPSEELRRDGLDVARLDPVSRARLKDEVFGRYLETEHIDCDRGDQLTAELRDFVRCVRAGTRPRVSGSDGRAALELAHRVLECVHACEFERPAGRLFERRLRGAA